VAPENWSRRALGLCTERTARGQEEENDDIDEEGEGEETMWEV
jgi:hypothetical protein